MPKLLLKKDGSLIRTRDFYDEDKKSWESSESDVTDSAWCHLSDDIEFEEGITLKDLFSLIHKNIEIFEGIFGNWIDEYTHVILNETPTEKEEEEQPIDYLRIYWDLSIDDRDNELSIPAWPNFGGFGIASHDDNSYKKGDVIRWGVGLSPMQNFADLPLKLEETVDVWYCDKKESKQYKSYGYTLYQVIQSVIWEISFHGGPSQTSKFMDGLKQQIERIKSGEEKTYPMEDLWKELDLDN
jgi:hypothetical protein